MSSLPTHPPSGQPLNAMQKQLIKLLAEIAAKELLERDIPPETGCESEEVCHARQ